MPHGDIEKFTRLLNNVEHELYSGCKYSRSSFLVKILYNKVTTNCSNKSFDLNLELFKDALLEDETLWALIMRYKNWCEISALATLI